MSSSCCLGDCTNCSCGTNCGCAGKLKAGQDAAKKGASCNCSKAGGCTCASAGGCCSGAQSGDCAVCGCAEGCDCREQKTPPRLDVIESGGDTIVLLECAGLAAKDLTVSLHDTHLVISGTSPVPRDTRATFKISERHHGSFSRSVSVPRGLKHSDITATHYEGLLRLVWATLEVEQAGTKIEIQKSENVFDF